MRRFGKGFGGLALLVSLLATRGALSAQTKPVVSVVATSAAPSGSRQIRVHDPSTVVKCGEDFWVFSTGHGIPSFHSKDTTNWLPGPPVFDSDPAWTVAAVPQHRGIYFWAPDVIRVGERYLLYYSVSVFGKNTSAIGLATNPMLDPADSKYHWADQGMVIESRVTNDFNAIDPAVFQGADGKLWLAFGSFWSGIKLIELDPQTGKRIAPDSPVHSLASADAIEAPYLYRHGGHYYLFVNWGRCCQGVKSTYNIRVGRSDKITGPYLDRDGQKLSGGGGSLFLATKGAVIGPGHAGIFSVAGKDWLSCHFYDGTREGKSTLAIQLLQWDADGWPQVISDQR